MVARNPFEPLPPEAPPEPGPPAAPEESAAPATPPPARHENLLARMREKLGKNPTLDSKQLYDYATRDYPDLKEAGFRSFHARYVLPLKREQARAEGRLPRRRRAKEPVVPKRPSRGRPSQAEGQPPATVAAGATAEQMVQVRARVRDVLLRLARQVAIAESRADLVDALARVEDMVDEVIGALQRSERGASVVGRRLGRELDEP